MIFAYADPPYIGLAHRYNCQELDHEHLVKSILPKYDAWALSCSSPTLLEVLSLCPKDVRVAAWVKPFCIYKPGVNPAYAWEPVIFWGGRKRGCRDLTVRDWVSANITVKKGLCGAKPEEFCLWIFSLLGALPNDTFVDLFPGTGGVQLAWDRYRASRYADDVTKEWA